MNCISGDANANKRMQKKKNPRKSPSIGDINECLLESKNISITKKDSSNFILLTNNEKTDDVGADIDDKSGDSCESISSKTEIQYQSPFRLNKYECGKAIIQNQI